MAKETQVKVMRFQRTPKKGDVIMVFMCANYERKHPMFKDSRFGIVQHVINEQYKGAAKGIDAIETLYIKECAPINTAQIDYFLDSDRVYFIE